MDGPLQKVIGLARMTLLRAEVARLAQEGRAVDEILQLLRARGCTKGESAAALLWLPDLGDNPLLSAKRIVHESPAWADVKERDDRILDDF